MFVCLPFMLVEFLIAALALARTRPHPARQPPITLCVVLWIGIPQSRVLWRYSSVEHSDVSLICASRVGNRASHIHSVCLVILSWVAIERRHSLSLPLQFLWAAIERLTRFLGACQCYGAAVVYRTHVHFSLGWLAGGNRTTIFFLFLKPP